MLPKRPDNLSVFKMMQVPSIYCLVCMVEVVAGECNGQFINTAAHWHLSDVINKVRGMSVSHILGTELQNCVGSGR